MSAKGNFENLVGQVDVLDVLRRARRTVVVRGHAVAEKVVAIPDTVEFYVEVRGLQARRILCRLQHRVFLHLVAPRVIGIDVVLDLVLGRRTEFGKQRCDFAKSRSGVVFKFLDNDWSLSHHFGLLSERRQSQTDHR